MQKPFLASVFLFFIFQAAFCESAILKEETSFPHGDKQIRIEKYLPENAINYPVVIILYGREGLEKDSQYRPFAEFLARRGYAAFIVDYFGEAPAMETDKFSEFDDWVKILHEAITIVGVEPDIDSKRIALAGFSVGATLAFTEASKDDRIHALIDFYGSMREKDFKEVKQLPPTLILHGSEDKSIPVRHAYELKALMVRKVVPHEMKIYKGYGHGFIEDAVVSSDAFETVLKFLKRHLS
jgi:dienelactone hydrolase